MGVINLKGGHPALLRSCMGLAPRAALIAVQALLRCLFKNNVPFLATAPGYNDFKERKKERKIVYFLSTAS
jgi:hypothetical protein